MESRKERKRKEKFHIIESLNKRRIFYMAMVYTALLISLIGRLYFVQLIKGPQYASCVQRQCIKEIPTGMERGTIYDTHMKPLTNIQTIDALMIFPSSFDQTTKNLGIISELTHKTKENIQAKLKGSHQPIQLPMVSKDEKKIQKIMGIKGVFPVDYQQRYDEKGLAAHVIGYINKIDNTGKKGIEKMYDNLLKKDQMYKVGAIVDAKKQLIPGLGYKILENTSSKEKRNVVTTIDYNIQKIAEEEMDTVNKKGSIVILDVNTGAVRAMVSRPNYDPNHVGAYLDGEDEELYNRGVQMSYPPGSLFKIIVSAAAIENKIANMEDVYFCKGYETIGDTKIKCLSFDRGGHGKLSFQKAFAYSCNSIFIQLGQKIGSDKLLNMAQKFGVGSLTNVGLLEEVPGRITSKNNLSGAGIGNFSIGQGSVEMTPIQIAKMTNIIANDGIDKGVYLIEKIIDDKNKVIRQTQNIQPKRVIQSDTANQIRTMMEKVVEMGTGKKAFVEGIDGMGGKTGSAETTQNGKNMVHAWYTGYFPKENPKYVMSIIVEDGKSGGKVCAPIFHNIAKRINEQQ